MNYISLGSFNKKEQESRMYFLVQENKVECFEYFFEAWCSGRLLSVFSKIIGPDGVWSVAPQQANCCPLTLVK